jgi:hypothetical protein
MVMKSTLGFNSVHEFSRRSTNFRSRVHGFRTQTVFKPLYTRQSSHGSQDAIARSVRDCRKPAKANPGKCCRGFIEVVEAIPLAPSRPRDRPRCYRARHCTYSGAENTSKKTLISAQNLENKEPEIFLPARSMVLKVVRRKILETLGLAWYPTAFSFTRVDRASALKDVSEKTWDEAA